MDVPQADLPELARYLRFPLRPDHRARLCDGSVCPHCSARGALKWGRFSGRQRYRCRECGRTFSTFTSSPLYHLKRPDLWSGFLWCMEGRLTVRRTGTILAIDKDTALRWRHRVLEHWRQEGRRRLAGQVVVGDFPIAVNRKGSRSLDRPPRKRGVAFEIVGADAGSVSILVGLERPPNQPRSRDTRSLWIASVPKRPLRRIDYETGLRSPLHRGIELVGSGGPASHLARYAHGAGLKYRCEPRAFFPLEVWEVRHELRAWLRPFRGVATRRLDNYLEWYRRTGWRRSNPNSADGQSAMSSGRRGWGGRRSARGVPPPAASAGRRVPPPAAQDPRGAVTRP